MTIFNARHVNRTKNPAPKAHHAPPAKTYSFAHLAGLSMPRGPHPPDNSPGASFAAQVGFKVVPIAYQRTGDAATDVVNRTVAIMARASACDRVQLAKVLLEQGVSDDLIAGALAPHEEQNQPAGRMARRY